MVWNKECDHYFFFFFALHFFFKWRKHPLACSKLCKFYYHNEDVLSTYLGAVQEMTGGLRDLRENRKYGSTINPLSFAFLWRVYTKAAIWTNKDITLVLQSSQVKSTPARAINEFIIQKLNPLVVVDFRFIPAFLDAQWVVNSHVKQLWNFQQRWSEVKSGRLKIKLDIPFPPLPPSPQ